MKSIGIPLQYACFLCRKSFKRPQFTVRHNSYMTSDQVAGQIQEIAKLEAGRDYKCPDCGRDTHFMGQDFKAPKRSDVKAWTSIQTFIESGKIYYRGPQQDS